MPYHFSKPALAGLFAVLLGSVAFAGEFVSPTDREPVFLRERLPIDVEAMRALSDGFVAMAKNTLSEPEERRAAAQAIALALALDPGNADARIVSAKLAKGEDVEKPESGELASSRRSLWQYQAWLASAGAGQDGNLLATLAGDTLSVLDAGHSEAAALKEAGERGNWDGWVAGLDEFRKKVTPKEKADKEKKPGEGLAVAKGEPGGNPSDSPSDEPKESENLFLLKQGSVRTAQWKWNASNTKTQDGSEPGRLFKPDVLKVTMKAKTKDSGGGFEIKVKEMENKNFLVKNLVSKPITDALTAKHGPLPKNGEILLSVGSKGSYTVFRNAGNLSGPGFILADAAITGTKPDALVIAALDKRGKLGLAKDFWRLLTAMKTETGLKIVFPAEAEEYLIGLLTLENVGFFLENEVFLASSNDEFIALSAQKRSGEIASIHRRFEEIREKSVGNDTGAYLANHFVRQRLLEIADDAPYHISAKLLALQGAGRRPPSLTEKILASEIWRIMVSVSTETKKDYQHKLNEKKTIEGLKRRGDGLRAELDAMERYTDIRNRDLLNDAVEVASNLRDISRALDGRGEYYEKFSDAGKAQNKLRSGYKELMKKLGRIIGKNLPADQKGS